MLPTSVAIFKPITHYYYQNRIEIAIYVYKQWSHTCAALRSTPALHRAGLGTKHSRMLSSASADKASAFYFGGDWIWRSVNAKSKNTSPPLLLGMLYEKHYSSSSLTHHQTITYNSKIRMSHEESRTKSFGQSSLKLQMNAST